MNVCRAAFLVVILTAAGAMAAPCNCVVSPFNDRGTPDTAFTFANGQSVVLCGTREESDGEVSFSDFTLNVCNSDAILGHWGAVASCRLQLRGNILNVNRVVNLPVGRDLSFVPTVLFTDKIAFSGKGAKVTTTLNPKARKYSKAETNAVLAEYEAAPRVPTDKTEELLFKLFVCVIGKNPKAQQYFTNFDREFPGMEGDLKKTYEELKDLVKLARGR